MFGDPSREVNVLGPGQVLLPGGAEFHARHEDDVGTPRQVGEAGRAEVVIQQVGADELDAGVGQPPGRRLVREGRNGDQPGFRARPPEAALDPHRQGRPHLAAGAQDDDIALEPPREIDVLGIRLGQERFEFLDALGESRLGHG